MTVDPNKLNEFVGRFAGDLGAALHASTVVVGDQLGLYQALAEAGPLTAEGLAQRTGTDARLVREWLAAQAASGYVTYVADQGEYTLTPEQAFTLADRNSPAFLPGAFYIAASLYRDVPKLVQAYRTGQGLGWHEHDTDLFCGTELFFRPGYLSNLVSAWLPALDGVVGALEAGARVADVGCGHGASTLLMARAYPRSTFVGYDYHDRSIQAAREAAAQAGLSDRVTIEVASAKEYPGRDFDLVAMFDCLHDLGDPAGAAAHVRQSLAPNGVWMIVEPFANESLEENFNPVGRIFYSASAMICAPASRAQEVGLALGAQASEAQLRQVVTDGGFTHFRRATQTPFNRVFEARA